MTAAEVSARVAVFRHGRRRGESGARPVVASLDVRADRCHDAKLRRVLSAFPGQGFAVLDGARFEDLPKLCRRERLFARSLFLDHANVEVEKAGPWLVALGQAPDATEKVLALVGAEHAAVYWCCDAGEAVLYRHLRTLNMARIPAWAAAGGTAAPGGLLAIRSDQMEALSRRRLDASHRRIAAYLRSVAGPQTDDLDEASLLDAVRRHDEQAKRFGLREERDIMLWSFVQLTSTHDLSRNEAVVRFLADPDHGTTPKARFQAFFDFRCELLKQLG